MSDATDQQRQRRFFGSSDPLHRLILVCGITLLVLRELFGGLAAAAMALIGGTTAFALSTGG